MPARLEDGGGWDSTGDWLSGKDDAALADLRESLQRLVTEWGLVARLQRGSKKCAAGMLSAAEVARVGQVGQDFARARGLSVSLDVAEGQPFVLGLMQALLELTGDGDCGLPKILERGVQAGVLDTYSAV